MSTLRRKPGRPKPTRGPVTLELRPKDRNGATSRHRVVKVEPYTRDVPGIAVWVQDDTMAVSFALDEGEVSALVNGLRDALQASKETAASRESQEAGQEE